MDSMTALQAANFFRAERDKFVTIAKTLNPVPQ